MLSVGPIGFFAPWALLGLFVLPVVWWLVRFLPPTPRHVLFPAARFLANAERDQPQQRSSMWWILLLRLVAVSALVIAAAEPVARPSALLDSSGPVVIVIDDGWAAAPGWPVRRDVALSLVARAEREDRSIMLSTTAPTEQGDLRPPAFTTVAEARRSLNALQPKPWPAEPAQAFGALLGLDNTLDKAGRIYWLSDGMAPPPGAPPLGPLVERLMRIGPVTVFRPAAAASPLLIRADRGSRASLSATVSRAVRGEAFTYNVVAYDEDGVALGRTAAAFEAGENQANAVFDLPLELRNRTARLAVAGQASAGAVALLDERWRRKTVGLVSAGGTGDDQPLLSGLHYVVKALGEANEVRIGNVDDLLDAGIPVLVFDDPGTLTPDASARLADWTENGGVLIVFAGPRFADAAFSEPVITRSGQVTAQATGWGQLLPVTLRRGDRTIGGAMSWREPATIAPFGSESPFAGLTPAGDVRIGRQVLAEPDLDIEQRTWAKLSDGTPLVTGRPRGQGWSILVHVTANAEWSNLPLSGLFVDMLSRMTALSKKTSAASENRILAPLSVLDGFGAEQSPPARVSAIASQDLAATVPSPEHPPGYYGDAGERRALNLADGIADLRPAAGLPGAVEQRTYVAEGEQPIGPWLFAFALILLFGDLLASLWLRGYIGNRSAVPHPSRAGVSTAGAVVFALLVAPSGVAADSHESLSRKIEAAARTRIAYIETGDRKTDQVTSIGLAGLGRVLHQRTAVELAEPQAIDPSRDELAFYPLIYWPVIADSEVPSGATAQRINNYLENGGMILFDAKSTDSAVADTVVRIADALDVPKLAPVPEGHVLTRAFYLLSDFPGRWAGRPVWLAPAANRVNDGVAPIIAGSHDWTAAWAMDEFQEPLFAVVPGGERQRELAFRFGVNLMMYALTGNYKADQVHIPSIMQRLGQ